MRLRLGASLALVACVAACQAVPVSPKATRPSLRPKPAASEPAASPLALASPEATASATPTAVPSPSPSAAPTPAIRKLKKPAGTVVTLTGQIRIDAHYLNASRAGSILSNNGSGLGVVGNATLVSNNGGTLISNNGGSVIAAGSGNVISGSGGAPAAFGLLQAASGLAVGAILPVAGLEIVGRIIADDTPLPLGEDDAGKPVYSIFSNAEGAFEVYLPPGTAGVNVLITAKPPTGSDSRLRYDQYVSPQAGTATIDEDTALITAYIRESAARQLEALFAAPAGSPSTVLDLVPEPLRPAFAAIETRLRTAATQAKANEKPYAERLVIARRAADAMQAFVDLRAVKFQDNAELVIPAITSGLKEVREAAATKLSGDPAFFTRQAWLVDANAALPAGEAPYQILKPTDVGDFLNRAIMGTIARDRKARIEAVLSSIDAPLGHSDLLIKADFAISSASSLTLVSEPKAVDAVEKAILAATP